MGPSHAADRVTHAPGDTVLDKRIRCGLQLHRFHVNVTAEMPLQRYHDATPEYPPGGVAPTNGLLT